MAISKIGVELYSNGSAQIERELLRLSKIKVGVDGSLITPTSIKATQQAASKMYKGLDDLAKAHAKQKQDLLDKQLNEEKVYGANIGAIRAKYLKQFTALDNKQADERLKAIDDKRIESVLAKQAKREEDLRAKRIKSDAEMFAKRVKLSESSDKKEEGILLNKTKRDEVVNAKRIKSDAELFAKRVKLSEEADKRIEAQNNRRAKDKLSNSFKRVTNAGVIANENAAIKKGQNEAAGIFNRTNQVRLKGLEAVRDRIFTLEEQIRIDRVNKLVAGTKAEKIEYDKRIKLKTAELQLNRSSEKQLTGGRTFTEQLEKNVLSRASVGGVNLGDVFQGGKLAPGGMSMLKVGGVIAGVAAIGKGLQESIEQFSKYEDALADLSALTGVSGSSLDSLGDKARSLGLKFGIDAPQAIESFKLVLSALGPQIAKDQDALESMGNSVLTLAKASGADAQTATAALTTTLNQFGLGLGTPKEQAIQMSRIMNVMAAGAKEGAAEVPQLAAAMKEVGATAKEQGVSVEGAAAAIEVLSQRGINGAEAGTAYRNVLSFMASGTKEAEAALTKLGLTFADINPQIVGQEKGLATLKDAFDKVKDPVEKSGLLLDIFKRENQNAALVLMESSDALGKMTQAITGTNTATEQANTKMSTLSQQWEKLKTTVGDVFISIGNIIAPGIEMMLAKINQFASGIQSAIKGVRDFFTSSETLIKEANAEIAKEVEKRTSDAMARTARAREFFEGTAKRLEIIKNMGKPKPKTQEEIDKEKKAAEKDAKERLELEKQSIEFLRQIKDGEAKATISNDTELKAVLIENERAYLQEVIDLYKKAGEVKELNAAKHAQKLFNIEHGKQLGTVGTADARGVSDRGNLESISRTGGGFIEQKLISKSGKLVNRDEYDKEEEAFNESINASVEKTMQYVDVLRNAFGDLFNSINQSFLTPMQEGLTKNLGTFGSFVGSIISGLVQLGEQALANLIMSQVQTAIFTATTTAAMATIQAASAPAAMLANIASFGGASIAGIAGLTTAMGIASGLAVAKPLAEGGEMKRGGYYITGEGKDGKAAYPELIDYTGSSPKVIPLNPKGGYNSASTGVMSNPFGNLGGIGQDKQSIKIGGFISASGSGDKPMGKKKNNGTNMEEVAFSFQNKANKKGDGSTNMEEVAFTFLNAINKKGLGETNMEEVAFSFQNSINSQMDTFMSNVVSSITYSNQATVSAMNDIANKVSQPIVIYSDSVQRSQSRSNSRARVGSGSR